MDERTPVMSTITRLTLILLVATLTTACIVEEEPQMRPAAGNVTTTQDAMRRMAQAGCDREAACNGFGQGRPYASRDACDRALGRESAQKFANCRYGVKDRELAACANEVRSETCGGIRAPLDWLDRSLMCRTMDLCLD
jgi:hypothetical protein